MSQQSPQNEASGSTQGQRQSAPRAGFRSGAQRVENVASSTAHAQQPSQRRTLDGYQVPVPRPDSPRRSSTSLRTTKSVSQRGPSAGIAVGSGSGGSGGGAGGSAAAGPSAGGSGGGMGRGGIGAPAPRFDASRRPPPILGSATLGGKTAFPPPIPRRDLMRLQRQAQQADRQSRRNVASSSARQLRADVGQRLQGMFPPSSTIYRRVENQPTAIDAPSKTSGKVTTPYRPLRQVMEEERMEEMLRRRKQDENPFRARRIGARPTVVEPKAIPPHPSLPVAYLDERLRLRIEGKDDDEMDIDEDEDEVRPNLGTQQATKRVVLPVKRFAARKTDMMPASSSSSSSESSSSEEDDDDDDGAKSAGSGATLEYVSDPEDHRAEPSDEDDDDIYATDEDLIPDIIVLSDPRYAPPSSLVGASAEPPPEMIDALEAVVPAINLQRIKRLPFKLKTLRLGFLKLCRRRGVPSYSSGRPVTLSVLFTYKDGALYQLKVEQWQCPLCALMGVMPTRQMLEYHLEWDHPEMFCEWRKLSDTQAEESWELEILVPELVQPASVPPAAGAHTAPAPIHPSPQRAPTVQPPSSRASSVHPPPSTTATPSLRRSTTAISVPETPEEEEDVKPIILDKPIAPPAPASRSVTASSDHPATTSATPSTSRPTSSTSRPSHQRSTTASSGSAVPPPTRQTRSATATSAVTAASSTRKLILPPRDDPLGPAARPPYLPAESDYDGPTVYYSCRPGGACLFDLLGTLSLKPYGLLDWEVIDREEEIYESDDVKDEYKVMQALWCRWIMLNRNFFVSNYFRGIIAFVDQYWLFIHKAAGWAALRYWLFALLANDFLTTHEIAETLKHYEEKTDMANWYKP